MSTALFEMPRDFNFCVMIAFAFSGESHLRVVTGSKGIFSASALFFNCDNNLVRFASGMGQCPFYVFTAGL